MVSFYHDIIQLKETKYVSRASNLCSWIHDATMLPCTIELNVMIYTFQTNWYFFLLESPHLKPPKRNGPNPVLRAWIKCNGRSIPKTWHSWLLTQEKNRKSSKRKHTHTLIEGEHANSRTWYFLYIVTALLMVLLFRVISSVTISTSVISAVSAVAIQSSNKRGPVR